MARHSFYLATEFWQEPYQLTEGEAHHLDRVLRIRVGATVHLFDGAGRYGLFTVTEKSKKKVLLQPQKIETTPPAATQITLAAGFSKALRRSWFLEKAVELEAHALWLWQGDYSQSQIPDKEKDTWKNTLISGAKQCQNVWLPDLQMLPNGVTDIIEQKDSFDKAFFLYEGDTKGNLLQKEDFTGAKSILLIVGPEGGFSPREVESLSSAGIAPVSMGNRILRWETAAILALGLAWWAKQ